MNKRPGAIFLGIVSLAAALLAAGLHRGAAATASEGAIVYEARCAACHQSNGHGSGPYPALAGNPDVVSADTQQLIATVVDGRTGPVRIGRKTYGATMPAERGLLSNEQIAAVLTYIRSSWGNKAPAISENQIATAAQPVAFSGATIFVTTCGNCHPSGGGSTASAPPLDGNPHVTAADPKAMIAIIVSGMHGPLTVNGKTYDAPMPSWRTRLSNADVAAVVTYIRSAWSNSATAVTEAQVAAAGPTVSAAIGYSIYTQRCSVCHGANGAAGGRAVILAQSPRISATDPTELIRTVKDGVGEMPSWKSQLSDADIASVLTYIRSSWRNSAGPVTEAQVAGVK